MKIIASLITATLVLLTTQMVLARTGAETSCPAGCTCFFETPCFYTCCGLNNCTATCLNARGIDPTATLSANGQHVGVTGHVDCTSGVSIDDLEVTVAQNGTGAVATGHVRGSCDGTFESWAIQCSTNGSARFVEGSATACGLVRLSIPKGPSTHAEQWCVDVKIKTE